MKEKTYHIYRSAVSGRMVTRAYAEANPEKAVREAIKVNHPEPPFFSRDPVAIAVARRIEAARGAITSADRDGFICDAIELLFDLRPELALEEPAVPEMEEREE